MASATVSTLVGLWTLQANQGCRSKLPSLRSRVDSMLDLAEKPENLIRLTLSYQIQRCGLQNLIGPDQPGHTPLTEDLLHPLHNRDDLRPTSFERLELLDLPFEPSNGLVQQGINIHCALILVDTVSFVWSRALTLRNHPLFEGKFLDMTIVFISIPDVGIYKA